MSWELIVSMCVDLYSQFTVLPQFKIFIVCTATIIISDLILHRILPFCRFIWKLHTPRLIGISYNGVACDANINQLQIKNYKSFIAPCFTLIFGTNFLSFLVSLIFEISHLLMSFHLHLSYPLLFHSFTLNSKLTCFTNHFCLNLFMCPLHGFLDFHCHFFHILVSLLVKFLFWSRVVDWAGYSSVFEHTLNITDLIGCYFSLQSVIVWYACSCPWYVVSKIAIRRET